MPITVDSALLQEQATVAKSAKVCLYWERSSPKWHNFCKVSQAILTKLTGKQYTVDPNTADMKFIQRMLDMIWTTQLVDMVQVKK